MNFFACILTFKCCIAILLTLLAEVFGALLDFTPSPPLSPTLVDTPSGRLLATVSSLPGCPCAFALVPRNAEIRARHGRQPEVPLAHHLTGSEARCGTVRGAGEDSACILLGPLRGPKPVSALLPDFLSSGKGSGRAGIVVFRGQMFC